MEQIHSLGGYMKLQLFLVTALAAFSLHANAASRGESHLRVFGTNSSWDYTLENETVTGQIWGFSRASGRVNLEKVDGQWEGRLGLKNVRVMSVETSTEDDGDQITEVTLRVFPGGSYRYTIKQELEPDEDGEYIVSGSAFLGPGRGLFLRGKVDEDTFSGGNQLRDFYLSRDKAGEYGGFSYQQLGSRFPRESYLTEFTSTGALMPLSLIHEDKVLFLILYQLPYSLTNW